MPPLLAKNMAMFLLRNAERFAPQPLGRADLLVAGDKIVWRGTELASLPAALEVEEIDLEGRRLIPGLIDCHAHITGGGGETGGARFRVPRQGLSGFTGGGVTTVVGLLGTDDLTRTTADLVATARGLTEEGITAYCFTGGYHLPATTLTGSVRGDITHIDAIIGVGELALSDHRSSQPTLDELLRIASEAHVAGLMTGKAGLVHLHMGDGRRGLSLVRQALDVAEVPARVYNPTHVNRTTALFDEALELAARGCTVDLTAFPVADEEDAWSAVLQVVANSPRSSVSESHYRSIRAESLRTELMAFMEPHDAIICPVSAHPALLHGFSDDPQGASAYKYTQPYSVLGWPSAVVRVGTSKTGGFMSRRQSERIVPLT